MMHTLGERLNIRFNRKIKLECRGARLISEGGLLACQELDEALGLFNLDYSRTEVAADARRDPCSCGSLPQMGHNKADAVRSVRPKGKKCQLV